MVYPDSADVAFDPLYFLFYTYIFYFCIRIRVYSNKKIDCHFEFYFSTN